MAARGKLSKLFLFFTEFLTTFILIIIPSDSSKMDFGTVQKSRKDAEIPIWRIMLTYATFSKIAHHSVCLMCAIPKIFYVKNRNYLENVRLRRRWCRSRFRKENWNFWNSNIAKLAVPPISPDFETLEISIMMLYLDDTMSFRPKMLGVKAHLYRLLSPKI